MNIMLLLQMLLFCWRSWFCHELTIFKTSKNNGIYPLLPHYHDDGASACLQQWIKSRKVILDQSVGACLTMNWASYLFYVTADLYGGGDGCDFLLTRACTCSAPDLTAFEPSHISNTSLLPHRDTPHRVCVCVCACACNKCMALSSGTPFSLIQSHK